MARKKSAQRKVKMGGDSKRSDGTDSSEVKQEIPDGQEVDCEGQDDANTEVSSTKMQSDQSSLFSNKHPSQRKSTLAFAPVKVKEEPKIDFDSQVCSKTPNRPHGYIQKEPSIKLPKVKQEQDLKTTKLPRTSPAMDLGSHLHQSLNAPHVPSCSGLTWSHLMEPTNFPRAYKAGTSVAVKKENPHHAPAPRPASSKSQSHSPSEHGYNPFQDDLAVACTSTSTSNPPVTGISSLSNRFSSSSTNSGKVGGGASILDLSKKGLPPEIRKMLASKYGLPKRNEDGSSVVPNLSKSRSRFTVGPRKTAGSDSDPVEKVEKVESTESLQPSIPDQARDIGETKISVSDNGRQAPMGSPRTTDTSVVSKSSFPASADSGSNVSVVENRDSGRSPAVPQAGLGHQATKDDSDQLKNHGMLDLASHYGNLLKETTPAVRPRSTSRSPRVDELSASPGPQNAGEPMIDLGNVSRINELRGGPLRRVGEPMINLSSMETPKSPLSPSFRPVSFGPFPNPNYRPNNHASQSYRARAPAGRTTRHSASPGLVPRLPFGSHANPPLSPDPRSIGSMIDLGSFGKGNDFPSMVSSRPTDIASLPSQVTRRIIPKRRHSLDSISLRGAAKRSCTEPKKDERLVKVESDVKLNIGDVLKLEQEEQKYIKDLSFIQNKLTDVRFKIQMMQQELETLQSSEADVRRCIDIVRTKRVRILKDAQGRVGSPGSSRVSEIPNISRDRIQPAGGQVGGELVERMVSYGGRSPGYLGSFRDDQSDGFRASTETKRKVEVVTDLEAEEKELTRGSERMVTRRVEIDRFGGYHYSNHMSGNRHNVPPRLVLQHSSHGVNNHNEVGLVPSRHYALTSVGSRCEKFNELDDNELQRDLPGNFSEDMDKHSGIIESGDGTLLVRQHALPSHHVGKCSNVFEEVKSSERNAPKQFLGCLEISSTTEEETRVENSKILAEMERVTKNASCDQERISSTVSSLDENVDAAHDSLCAMEFVGHTDAVCAILPFKKKLFSASADRTVKAFDLKTGECTNTFQGHQKGINCLQIASEMGNRDRLFTGSNDQTVRAYNAKSGTCTHKFSFRGRVMCLHIAFGKLFVGLSSGFVAVIDLKSNKCIDQFNCHEPSRISCIASASEGQRSLLCTGSFDSTITIRDQSSGLLLRTIKDHKLTVLCMQVVENTLFSGSADTVVQSHNINTGQLVRSFIGHSMSVSGLQALGGVLVTSSLDRIIRCFDIKSGELLQLYGGNNDMIFSLSVFRDMIYTGCRDGKLSGIKLDLRKYHCCKWGTCSLKLGLLSHLKQHVQDHVNQTYVFDSCLWEGCSHKFHRGKQLDVIQAAMEHIISHVPDTEK